MALLLKVVCLFALFSVDAGFLAPTPHKNAVVSAVTRSTPAVMAARPAPKRVVKKVIKKVVKKVVKKPIAKKVSPKKAAPKKAAPKKAVAAKKVVPKKAVVAKKVAAKKAPPKKAPAKPAVRGKDPKLAAYIASRKKILARDTAASAAAKAAIQKRIGKPTSRPLVTIGKGYGLSAFQFNILSEKEQKRRARSGKFY